MTKQDLKMYELLNLQVEQCQCELRKLRSINGTADIKQKIVELEQLYLLKLGESLSNRAEIESTINTLPLNEQLLVRYKYIDGLTWEEIAIKLSYSWRHVHRIHDKALRHLA